MMFDLTGAGNDVVHEPLGVIHHLGLESAAKSVSQGQIQMLHNPFSEQLQLGGDQIPEQLVHGHVVDFTVALDNAGRILAQTSDFINSVRGAKVVVGEDFLDIRMSNHGQLLVHQVDVEDGAISLFAELDELLGVLSVFDVVHRLALAQADRWDGLNGRKVGGRS